MTMVNAFQGLSEAAPQRDAELIRRRERALGAGYRLFYRNPLHIARAEGVWLFDQDGRPYLDAYNNVASVGHGRPEVVEAIAAQAAVLNTHTRYLNTLVVDYAEALLATLPPALGNVMFTCTGSEANDLALRIARTVTGGEGLIVTENAYHGVTASIAEASPSLGAGAPIGRAVWVVPAPPRGGGDAASAAFLHGVARALGDMRTAGVRPAALLVDTIFSSDGVLPAPEGLLAPAAAAVRQAGGLFIADEVQAGFGRVGTAFWGFNRHGVAPDLVTMGKPMGNGHPIAAVAARRDLIEAFGQRVRYFNTFGGNPVSCAAGMAVLRILQADRLPEAAGAVGEKLLAAVRGLAADGAGIGDVRGAGLYVGADVVDAEGEPDEARATDIVNHMRDNGVLISATGPRGHVLKIRPPLVFADEHVNILRDALAAALQETKSG